MITRLASDGVRAILEDNELLQVAINRMFPEERYDWMRKKDGDYEIEDTLCFSHHGAMLFLGERIKGLNRVIHAKDKK